MSDVLITTTEGGPEAAASQVGTAITVSYGVSGDVGPAGPAGAVGAAGPGLPVGGTVGQVPAKVSATDYDTAWVTVAGGGGAVDSVNTRTGVVVLGAADVGADATGTAATAVTAHSADTTAVHGIVDTAALIVEGDARLTNARTPTAHAHVEGDVTGLTAALAAKADATALTAHTGNVANPHTVTKAQVGLGSVDNTTDAATPVSTAQQTALDGKAAKSANLSDLASAATARTNLALGTAATVDAGVASGNVPLLGAAGTLAIARLATGTPDGTKFVRDDGTLAAAGFFPFPAITSTNGGDGTETWWTGNGKSGTRNVTEGRIEYQQLVVGQPVKITAFRTAISTLAASSTVSVGLYAAGVDGYSPTGSLLATLLAAAASSTTGDKSATGLSVTLTPGTYWLGYLAVGGAPLFTAAANDPLAALLLAHRAGSQDRKGGHDSGAAGLTALPATASLTASWDGSFNPFWFGLQTAKP